MPVGTAGTSGGIAAAPADAAGKTLTDNQIATWARSGGFTDNDVATAVAVALAESGGRYAAVSAPNFNGTRDYGLWQINSVHAQLFQQYPTWWDASNAKMAKTVHAGQGWKAWTTFNSGAYLLFMDRARKAKDATSGTSVGPTTDADYNRSGALDIPNPIADLSNVFRAGFQPLTAAGQWIGNADNWLRVAQVVLGAALVVGGITIVARPVATQLAGPVASVITKGKAS